MLSNSSRALTYALSILYAILGALLFLRPEQLAPVFAWKVTGFMTMTIGAWCLGNAAMAFITARRWRWGLVYPSLVYLWCFGLSEAAVVLFFRGKLQTGHPIAWLYLLTIAVNVLAAVVGAVDWLRLRPARNRVEHSSGSLRWFAIGFVVFVGFLGIYGLVAQIGDLATHGEIFPEVMSLFTLRSFGAFYLSLAISVFTLIFEKDRAPLLHQAYAALWLVVIITVAALAYLPLFNFARHPFQSAYFAAYFIAGFFEVLLIRRYGTGAAAI